MGYCYFEIEKRGNFKLLKVKSDQKIWQIYFKIEKDKNWNKINSLTTRILGSYGICEKGLLFPWACFELVKVKLDQKIWFFPPVWVKWNYPVVSCPLSS